MGYGRAVMRMTPTEAARHFKAVLGRVAAGEEIEVVRNGAPVAVIAPPPSAVPEPRARELAASAGDSFADDLRALEAQLEAPPDAWAQAS
jgi:antitoxin (DNA-binding transcriptional repressor) of toxin-antitoxin stability system